MQPIGLREFMDRLFLVMSTQLTEPIDRNDLLIAELPLVPIIARSLKTTLSLRMVDEADKHIQLNQLSFHSKTILLV